MKPRYVILTSRGGTCRIHYIKTSWDFFFFFIYISTYMVRNSGQLSHGCEKDLAQEKCGSVEGCRKLHTWNNQSTRSTERK